MFEAMKLVIVLAASLIPVGLHAQTSIDGFELADNETRVLSAAEGHENLILGFLKMGENSTLIVPDNFEKWHVYIQEVEAKFGARIVASGRNGANVSGTPATPKTHPKCSKKGAFGARGSDSLKGQDGAHGVPLIIQMGVKDIEALSIISDGGNGGASGNGGMGGKGGRGSCNRRCNGETGGTGGSALQSNGGYGGSIRLEFWFVDGADTDTNPAPGITLSSNGGLAGPIGSAGAGGLGGNRKSCPWPATNRAGGRQGDKGRSIAGRNGKDGLIIFSRVDRLNSDRLFASIKRLESLEVD